MAVTQASATSINPATGEVLARYDEFTSEQVEKVLAQVARTYREWRNTPYGNRKQLMHSAADYLRNNVGRFAGLASKRRDVDAGLPHSREHVTAARRVPSTINAQVRWG